MLMKINRLKDMYLRPMPRSNSVVLRASHGRSRFGPAGLGREKFGFQTPVEYENGIRPDYKIGRTGVPR